MSQISTTARERIQAQGFCGLNDATYAQINYPLRLSPGIMMVWVAVGTVLTSTQILWALVPFTALGAILTGHPFDVLYNQGLRYLIGSRKNCRAMGFGDASPLRSRRPWSRWPLVRSRQACRCSATSSGGAIVASTCLQVITGICGPAVLAGRLFGKVKCAEPERKALLDSDGARGKRFRRRQP